MNKIKCIELKKKPGIYSSTLNNKTQGNGTPLQYSCLEKPMDRGPWGR